MSEAKDALRAVAKQQIAEERARDRRAKRLLQGGVALGAMLAVAAVVAIVVFASSLGTKQEIPDARADVTVTTSDGGAATVPLVAHERGITVGQADAPVTVDYYFDFSCSHCVEYHRAMASEYEALVAEGEVNITYHLLRVVSDYGQPAGAAAAATAQYQPEQFLPVMHALFEVAGETQAAWATGDYADFLRKTGVTNQDALTATKDGHFLKWITDSTKTAVQEVGIPGTPSVYIDGERVESLPTTGDELRDLLAQ